MPKAKVAADLDMHYLVDDYSDPWREPEAVLMLHGNAENAAAWYGWVPHLARELRVVRPDMRGFGASTPMPRDYAWSLDAMIDDFVSLMRTLGFERFHLVGAKLGGTIARRFAARERDRVLSLTLAGTPPPQRDQLAARNTSWIEDFEKNGVEGWARATMAGRLGSKFPAAGVEWWTKMMGRTAVSTQVGFIATIPSVDISADLPAITCPTLVITTEGSALGSVQQTRAWQQTIPQSRLLVLPGDSYHVAASDADRCAQETLAFIRTSRGRALPA
jgi:pimeloyl-ACP methyl ester carboxylesterase